MKAKSGIILLSAGILILVVGFLFYISNKGFGFMDMLYAVLIILLLAGSSIIGIKQTKEIRKGLPVKDELAQKVAWKSGFYSYLFSLWLAVAMLWYNTFFVDNFNLIRLDFEYIIGIFVLLPGTVFIGLTFYFNRKGDL